MGARYVALLLRLMPSSFRERHGPEVMALFQQMKASRGPRPGRLALLRLYLGLTGDVLLQAIPRGGRDGGARSWSGWADTLAADVRFALRQYRRHWGTVLTMLGILSLGLSLTILLFSFVHAYAFSPPLSIPASPDLVRIRGAETSGVNGKVVRTLSEDELAAYSAMDAQFTAVTGWSEASLTMAVPGRYIEGAGAAIVSFVTFNYFEVLGVSPAIGRGVAPFASGDPAQERVVVIGDIVWKRVFDASPDVIGRTLQVQGVPLTVVGVAPPRFFGVGVITEHRLWVPLSQRDVMLPPDLAKAPQFRAGARLREGITPVAASAAVKPVAERLIAEVPAPAGIRDRTVDVLPLLSTNGDPQVERNIRIMAITLGTLALLVLLVTCTNVSALLMGLAVARRQEIVVRVALGAGRSRMIRQLLTESAVLGLIAGVAALWIVSLVADAAVRAWPAIPVNLAVSTPAILFSFTVALLAGVLFGLAPALQVTRVAIAPALRDSGSAVGGGRQRLQRGLVVAQVAFTQPLVAALVAVLLLVVSQMQPPAHSERSEQLVALELQLNASDAAHQERLRADVTRLQATLAAEPGVAGVVPALQGTGEFQTYRSHPEDEVPGGMTSAFDLDATAAAHGFFALEGREVVRGRELTPDDVRPLRAPGLPVPVIIGSDLARRLWPDADPIGRRLVAQGDSAQGWAPLEVVGVVEREASRRTVSYPVHVALPQDAVPTSLLIHTRGDAAPLLPAIARIAETEVPTAVPSARTMAEIQQTYREHFLITTRALSAAGFIALLLSGIGLYAVVAFAVGQRSQEIAVRMAIGAPSRTVARSFLRDGVRLGLTGVAFGLPVSLVGLHVFNVTIAADAAVPSVPLRGVTAVVATVVVLTACTATLLPALRAAGIDPAQTLRRA
jgi:putative ABC transport system permease protein